MSAQINLDVLLSNLYCICIDIMVQVLLFDQQKRGVKFTVYVTLYVFILCVLTVISFMLYEQLRGVTLILHLHG